MRPRPVPEGTIRLSARWDGRRPERPCVWCKGSTDLLAETPFRPDLGAVPLHMFCAAELTQLCNLRKLAPGDIA